MVSLKRKQQGFTIVELLIVIVVIGILAALVITTFTGIQQKARDTERTTDIKALQGQVEAYFAQKGNYPSLTDMNSTSFRTTNMKGLDSEALKDPKGATQVLCATASNTCYGFSVHQSDGTTSCESDDTACAQYTLTANLEGGGTFTKNNLN
jgi:prepilin-type N-terminal cleavage/methylation domain-containing protein